MRINLARGHIRNPKRKPRGSQRSPAARAAWEKALEVRQQMPRYAKQADVAKAINVSKGRLEQVELEVLTKVVIAASRGDFTEAVDYEGVKRRILKVVPGARDYLDKMSGASLLVIEEIIRELTTDHGSVFPMGPE